ncbi:unnamed protein product [Ilex paraguariensis]|uniref:Uncharacterized protein n=1 Tax=Ilex paraguariensis TaxID=185542 RepID=A0ABC8T0N9_9AQUA
MFDMMVWKEVKALSEKSGAPLFADDILYRFPGLKGGRFWKEEHDLSLLRAVLKHGYGRWQAIVDDKDLRVLEIICQELNLPFVNLPVPGASQAQVPAPGGPQAQVTASGSSQAQESENVVSAEVPGNQSKVTGEGNDLGADVAQGTTDSANRAQLYQDPSTLYHFREMQRRQVEFIKKRVLLLEKALNAEYQKEFFVSSLLWICYVTC